MDPTICQIMVANATFFNNFDTGTYRKNETWSPMREAEYEVQIEQSIKTEIRIHSEFSSQSDPSPQMNKYETKDETPQTTVARPVGGIEPDTRKHRRC